MDSLYSTSVTVKRSQRIEMIDIEEQKQKQQEQIRRSRSKLASWGLVDEEITDEMKLQELFKLSAVFVTAIHTISL